MLPIEKLYHFLSKNSIIIYYCIEIWLFLSDCLHYLLLMHFELLLWLLLLNFLWRLPIYEIIQITQFQFFIIWLLFILLFLDFFLWLLWIFIYYIQIQIFTIFLLFLQIFLPELSFINRMLDSLWLNKIEILILIGIKCWFILNSFHLFALIF